MRIIDHLRGVQKVPDCRRVHAPGQEDDGGSRMTFEDKLAAIPGLISIEECKILHDIVLSHPRTPWCLEIGCWKGRSSCAIASAAEARGGSFETVDPFVDYQIYDGRMFSEVYGMSSPDLVRDTLRLVCTNPMVNKATSDDFFSSGLAGVYNFAFIDGDHSYEAVCRDYRHAVQRMVGPWIIVFHDIQDTGACRLFGEIIGNTSMPHPNMGVLRWEESC